MKAYVFIFLFVIVVCPAVALLAGPSVVAVFPARHSLMASRTTDLTIDFDRPIDPSSVDSVSVKIFGHWSGVPQGIISLENNNQRIRFTASRGFNAGEYVLVNLAKTIRDTSGLPMSHGYAWMFWVRPSAGSMVLQETARLPLRRQGEGHIQTYGAYGGDFNGDGWMDLAMPNEISDDFRLMLNNGAGEYSAFTVHPLPGGNTPSPNEGADFNGDGLLDYVVGNAGNDMATIMIGSGNGTFATSTSYQAANAVRGVTILDLEGDGDWDVVTANRNGSNISLLKNNGNGTFAPRINIDANGTQETACAAADANNDGIMDMFVGTYGSNEMILLLGDGNGGLTYATKIPAGGKPWMIAVGDVNGDGNIDVVSANSFNNTCSVILGNGMGGMAAAVTYPTGSFSLAIDLGDIDGDGDLDLVTSNYGSGTWTVYENNGSGVLGSVRTLNASTAGSCCTLYDRDNDGDVDMTGIDEIDDLVFVFTNPGVVAVEPQDQLPGEYFLYQNYPNPFNPTTRIVYQIPASPAGRKRESVSLKIYDMLGKEVVTLVDEMKEPGEYSAVVDGTRLSSGVYFYRLRAGTFSERKKLLLLR